MKIAVLGAGRVGSTIGKLWHAACHDVTFAARSAARPQALAAELGERAHAASVADAVAGAEVALVAVPGPVVTDVLQAAGPFNGRVMVDAANSFGQQQATLRSLADAFPQAHWVRAFNSLSASIMADDNHHEPPWVMFLSGDEEAKPVAAQLIRDAGFDPVRPGWHRRQPAAGPRQPTVDQHPHSRRGDGARRADKVRGHGRGRSVGAEDAGARAGRAIRETTATTHRTIPRSSSSTCRARFSRPGSTRASSRPSGTASGRRSTASTRRRSPRCRPPRSRQ